MPRPDFTQDFRDLQNALSTLSMLAASAVPMQAALVAAQRVFSELEEANDTLKNYKVEQEKLQGDIDKLKTDLLFQEARQKDIIGKVKVAEKELNDVSNIFKVERDRRAGELKAWHEGAIEQAQISMNEAEKAAASQRDKLSVEIAKLEERRQAAESALQAIKASL